jgi:hypothetical protein
VPRLNLGEVTRPSRSISRPRSLLLGAPSPVDDRQLKDLHIQLSLTARERLLEEREHLGPAAAADHLVCPTPADRARRSRVGALVEALSPYRPASVIVPYDLLRERLRLSRDPAVNDMLFATPRLSSSPDLD